MIGTFEAIFHDQNYCCEHELNQSRLASRDYRNKRE